MAPISDASSTAQMTAVSLRASRQKEHKSSSVRLKHWGHGRTFSASVVSADASSLDWSGDCLRRWYVRRSAVLRPMPGSFDSSAARSSIAPTLEGELEGQIQAAGQLSHSVLRKIAGFFLGFFDGNEHKVFEHLDVLGISHARIDFDARNGPLPVGLDGHHTAASSCGNGLFL